MKRLHLIELMDYAWFPKVLRDLATDVLQELALKSPIFDSVVPIIYKVIQKTNTHQIIDLCSGAGGPWFHIIDKLRNEDNSVKLILSDRYPNHETIKKIMDEYNDKLEYFTTPVDAANVSSDLKGIRTLFAGFHHFKPEQAKAVLADAAEKRMGIAIFEVMSMPRLSSWIMLPLHILLSPLFFLFVWVNSLKAMKGNLPTKIARIFFTYIFPIFPLIFMFEAFVSGLRLYTKSELEEMTASLDAKDYTWEIDILQTKDNKRLPPIIYLIGYPR